uniref:Secreted protein n=1 Tax=Heterorhabditis bacteriophora TaxID=37862 RepID=A0A1I7W800_HETBA
MTLSWLSSITKGHLRSSSSSRLSSPLRNFRNQCRAVLSLTASPPNACFRYLCSILNLYNRIS